MGWEKQLRAQVRVSYTYVHSCQGLPTFSSTTTVTPPSNDQQCQATDIDGWRIHLSSRSSTPGTTPRNTSRFVQNFSPRLSDTFKFPKANVISSLVDKTIDRLTLNFAMPRSYSRGAGGCFGPLGQAKTFRRYWYITSRHRIPSLSSFWL